MTPSTSAGSTAVPRNQADSKAQLHADIDRLIAAVGPIVRVRQDKVLPCDPGNDAAGYAWTYGAVLDVPADGQTAAMDGAAQAMSERGYRVGRSPRTDEVDLTFRRAGFDLDMSFFPGKDEATVGGSGPCLKEKA